MMRSPNRRRRRVLLGAGAALVLAAAAGLAAWAWPAWRAERDARRALAAGRYADAAGSAERWVRLRPGSAEAQIVRARAALALGSLRDVGDGLRQAQRLGATAAQLALLRAFLDAQQGRPARARPVLEKAFVAAKGPDPMLDEALARVLLDLYDFRAAGAVLDRWGREAPRDPRPPLWLAEVHRRLNVLPEVILADYRESLRRDPAQPDALRGLAEELAAAHRNEEATAAYDAYLSVRPDDPAGLLGAGRNALELGDLDAAARRLDRALELDPSRADAYAQRAQVDLRRGDQAAALAHLDRAVALKPFDPALRYNRKLALVRLGKREEAAREQRRIDQLKADLDLVNDLQERLARSPGDADLQYALARWMFDHGYDQEGVTWSRKILAEHPHHAPTRALLAEHDRPPAAPTPPR